MTGQEGIELRRYLTALLADEEMAERVRSIVDGWMRRWPAAYGLSGVGAMIDLECDVWHALKDAADPGCWRRQPDDGGSR